MARPGRAVTAPLLPLLLAALDLGPVGARAERVYIDTSTLPYRVTSSQDGVLGRNGTIRGAGGWGHLEVARSSGADAMRTWDITVLNESLPAAEEFGLRISAGIWLTHEPEHYQDCGGDLDSDPFWNDELDRWLSAVRQHRESPALLWWTVGNEMEMMVDILAGSPCLWRRVEWVVQAVKAEDPDHPVGTVLAGVAEGKVRGLERLVPSVDFLGVNSYGDASLRVGRQLLEWNWTKPYALMEYGPRGHWESPLTSWGSYIEESSSQKVPRYNATCHQCQDDPYCVGGFAFTWGWKWEKTGTWYGMFNEWEAVTTDVAANCSGCESEVVPVLQQCWTGSPRTVMPPSIEAVSINGASLPLMAFASDTNKTVPLRVEVRNPDGSPLTAIWAVTREIVSGAVGGAHEDTNPLLGGRWLASEGGGSYTAVGLTALLTTEGLPVGGKYRLYVFVRADPDSCPNGDCPNFEAYASLPFEICHTAVAGEMCHNNIMYAMDRVRAAGRDPLYPGVNESSSFQDFQALLYQMGGQDCPMPCAVEDWRHTANDFCHTAVPGEVCYDRASWEQAQGVQLSPDLYPGLTGNSSLWHFQSHVYSTLTGVCPRPCEADRPVDGGSPDGEEAEPEEPVPSASCLAWSAPGLASVLAVGAAALLQGAP